MRILPYTTPPASPISSSAAPRRPTDRRADRLRLATTSSGQSQSYSVGLPCFKLVASLWIFRWWFNPRPSSQDDANAKWCLHGAGGHLGLDTRHSCILPVLLRAGATFDMASIEGYSDRVGYAYLAKVHAAGGWKRYAQAHTARLAPIFAKAFPHARLPPELVAHIVDLWAHVGYY